MSGVEKAKRGRPIKLTDQLRSDLVFTEGVCATFLRSLRDGSEGIESSVYGSAQMIHTHGADGESITLDFHGNRIIAESGRRISAATGQAKLDEHRRGLVTRFFEAVWSTPSDRRIFEILTRPANNVQQVRKVLRKYLPYEVKTEVTIDVHHATSPILKALHERTDEFCRSKVDARYPKAKWSDDERIQYLSRVWAGLSLGLSASYSEKILRELAAKVSSPDS